MNIILAEDQPLILQSLKLLLSEENDINVVATASRGDDVPELCRRFRPDVAVLDIRMPGLSGLDAAEILKREMPRLPVLLLTTFEEPETIQRALREGVEGFLLKDVDPVLFVTALRALAGGLTVLHPAVRPYLESAYLPKKGKSDPSRYGLTKKDLDVITLIVQGLGNKEIAQKEGCSEGTVKNRVSSILNKMGLSARTQIAVTALREELV